MLCLIINGIRFSFSFLIDGTAPQRKEATAVDIIRALLTPPHDNSPKAVRDSAIIVLGFAGALSCFKLYAFNMDVEDGSDQEEQEIAG